MANMVFQLLYQLNRIQRTLPTQKILRPSIIPGYVTTNVNAYWQVTPMIKFFTNIENIGDVKYKTAYNGSNVYYINGGRLASAGVTFRY